jgi:hypothetical protein
MKQTRSLQTKDPYYTAGFEDRNQVVGGLGSKQENKNKAANNIDPSMLQNCGAL